MRIVLDFEVDFGISDFISRFVVANDEEPGEVLSDTDLADDDDEPDDTPMGFRK